METTELSAPDPGATLEIARRLGRRLRPDDVVCLYGELGAGKTSFTKGLAEALGIPAAEITSASFTIVAEHRGRIPLFHVDFYRLDEAAILDLGIEELFDAGGVTVIEWPERAPSVLPPERFEVRIDFAGPGRRIRIDSPRPLCWT